MSARAAAGRVWPHPGDWVRGAIRRFGPLRAVVGSRAVQRVIKTARAARALRQPFRFAALEAGSSRTASHRLRGSGRVVVLRHRTRDVDVFTEIFGGGAGGHCYEPPRALRRLLRRDAPLRVLDLGGNVGLFGAYAFSRWPRARVASFEPDPSNFRILSSAIVANGLADRWAVVQAAVGTQSGRAPFAAGLFADSHLTDAGPDTTTVRVVDLFGLDHDVDLLKMDIEGGEWPILADSRLGALGARAVLLEWHGRSCSEADAHSRVVRQLRQAGYGVMVDGARDLGADVGVLWAWREPDNGAVAGRRLDLGRRSRGLASETR